METMLLDRRTCLQFSLAAFAPARKHRAVIIGHTGRGNYGHDWDTSWNGITGVEVVAVADPEEAGRTKAMARSQAVRGYADYREMLRKEKPDLVAICPRWCDQRVAMFTAAAEAGAHVLIEKPLAATVEEADRMVSLAERHNIKVQVGHTARPMPEVALAQKMVEGGEIGQLLEIRARGKEDTRAGGEDMMVLGTHLFDLMRYFAGDPRWVFGHVTQAGREMDAGMARQPSEPVGPVAGDEIAAVFYFERGAHGYFGSRSSDVRTGARFGVTLYGSKGLIFIPLTAVPGQPPYVLRSTAWVSDGGQGQWQRLQSREPLKTRQEVNNLMARDLIAAVESGREPVCGATDGRWTVEMLCGVYQSHLAGRRLAFPLKDRRHPLVKT
jgi:predicted dehydrogenase